MVYTNICVVLQKGLDNKLGHSASYIHLKDGEKYPKWCPYKDEIEKEGSD